MLDFSVLVKDKPVKLIFEHSLLSVARWEAKHKKAFLSTTAKTTNEMVEYFEDMLIVPHQARELVYMLSPEQLEQLTDYVNDSQTASFVPDTQVTNPFDRETVTSELVYYWMVTLQIPFEAEKWHLSRLMMLVRIVNFKNQPPEKQNKQKMLANWREINERRKAQYNTKG